MSKATHLKYLFYHFHSSSWTKYMFARKYTKMWSHTKDLDLDMYSVYLIIIRPHVCGSHGS